MTLREILEDFGNQYPQDKYDIDKAFKDIKALELSRTKMSQIVGKYIYLENGKWILHDNGCDKIAVAIYDQIQKALGE